MSEVRSGQIIIHNKRYYENPPPKRASPTYYRCIYCRKSRVLCKPVNRTWPQQKCDECTRLGKPCSPNVTNAHPLNKTVHCTTRRQGRAKGIKTRVNGNTKSGTKIILQDNRFSHNANEDQMINTRVQLGQSEHSNVSGTFSSQYDESRLKSADFNYWLHTELFSDDVLVKSAVNGHLTVVNRLLEVRNVVQWLEVKDVAGTRRTEKFIDIRGIAALWKAGINGQIEVVNTLLSHMLFSSPVLDSQNYQPLHKAAMQGYVWGVKFLLHFFGNPDVRTSQGETPFLLAIMFDHWNVAEVLLQYNADPYIPSAVLGYCPIHYATDAGNINVVEKLIELGEYVDAETTESETPLMIATLQGHFEMATLLIRAKANIYHRNILGTQAIHIAAKWDRTDLIRLLISHGADIDAETKTGKSALLKAAKRGNKDTIVELLANKASLKSPKSHPILVVAAKGGNMALVKHLLMNKFDPDIQDYAGKTALSCAVQNGNLDLVEILLQSEARMDLKEDSGKYPIHDAVYLGHKAVLKALIDNGAALDILDAEGQTPLTIAARQGFTLIVETLISNGARTDFLPTDVLAFIASLKGHEEFAEILRQWFSDSEFQL